MCPWKQYYHHCFPEDFVRWGKISNIGAHKYIHTERDFHTCTQRQIHAHDSTKGKLITVQFLLTPSGCNTLRSSQTAWHLMFPFPPVQRHHDHPGLGSVNTTPYPCGNVSLQPRENVRVSNESKWTFLGNHYSQTHRIVQLLGSPL